MGSKLLKAHVEHVEPVLMQGHHIPIICYKALIQTHKVPCAIAGQFISLPWCTTDSYTMTSRRQPSEPYLKLQFQGGIGSLCCWKDWVQRVLTVNLHNNQLKHLICCCCGFVCLFCRTSLTFNSWKNVATGGIDHISKVSSVHLGC